MNVVNTCGGSCAECDAHGNSEPCPHDCNTYHNCDKEVEDQ